MAEGVEDADQFAVLRDLGVHAYQGWLFARAMPAEAFTEVLRRGPLTPAGPRRRLIRPVRRGPQVGARDRRRGRRWRRLASRRRGGPHGRRRRTGGGA